MKFTYDGEYLARIIEHYERNENEFTIYYLNGSVSKYVSDDVDEEAKIQKTMIKQALQRQTKLASKNMRKDNNIYLMGCVLSTLLVAIATLDKNDKKLFVLPLLSDLYFITNYIYNNRRIKELEKYELYFSMLDNNLIDETVELNINNLDEHSYKDVKKLSRKLTKNNN